MGAMKTIHHWRVLGRPLSQTIRAFAGLEPWPLSKEERAAIRAEKAELRAALREAAEEAKVEREAIQWVERQAELRAAATSITRLQPPPIPTANAVVNQPTLF